MSEQKQSLADFVFENKDKMPDNVYKILMEQYAKQDELKGFVEVEYLEPKVIDRRGSYYDLVFKKHKVIVKKYDDRFVSCKEIKIGTIRRGRVCPHPYSVGNGDMSNPLFLLQDIDVHLIKNEDDDNANDDAYELNCDDVIVISVKDL